MNVGVIIPEWEEFKKTGLKIDSCGDRQDEAGHHSG